MRLARLPVALAVALCVAGCANMPAPPGDDYEDSPIAAADPAPVVEPVEPPPAAAEAPAPAAPSAAPAPAPAVPAPQPAPAEIPPTTTAMIAPAPVIVTVPPEISAEEQQLNSLLADLQRYGSISGDDARRELNTVTQAFGRQRTDANRVRLAMLYTVTRAGPQDDQRALQLLDNVSKSGAGSPAIKQLAAVLLVQISERVRAVHDEQQKADAAIQKLEALRAMERSLLRDRVRGGGGAGGGGSSGGGGGGSAGGGAGG